jgi:hypothetical protein
MPFVSRRLPLVVLAVVLGTLVGLVARSVISQPAAMGGREPGAHQVNAHASWKFHFDTSAAMLATADLAVEGTVTSISRGRILPGNSEVKQQLKEIRITTTKVWKGALEEESLVVEDAGWEISSAPGEGEMELVIADTVQPAPGDHGIFFLRRNQGTGRLSFINNQGVFLLRGGQVMDTPRSDPLVQRIERLSEPGIRQQLRGDLRLVKAGAVLPKRPA